MTNSIQSIAIDRLLSHPDNPNRMSKTTFAKLVRNIERSGRYEPLVVRPYPGREGFYQIINGHHRRDALEQLGYKMADVVVWDVNDKQAQILLATLNRLAGNDVLEKKLALLKKLSENFKSGELAKLLPQTAKQIERLTTMRLPAAPTTADGSVYAIPVVFFVSNEQIAIIEKALALVERQRWSSEMAITNPRSCLRLPLRLPTQVGAAGQEDAGVDAATREDKACELKPTKARRKAAALTAIAEYFLSAQSSMDDPLDKTPQ